MKKITQYSLGIISGLILGLSFPPFPFYWIAFIGFIPFLYVLLTKEKGFFWFSYLTFFIYHGITAWWIGSWQPVDESSQIWLRIAGVAVWLVHPFFFCIPIVVFKTIKDKLSSNFAIWSFPFLWISFEWLHSLSDIAFPWLTIGYTQTYNYLWVQFADVFGVWGLSFLIILVNVLILKIILITIKYNDKIKLLKFLFYDKKLTIYLLIVVLIIIIPVIYGAVRIKEYDHSKLLETKKIITIGIIQPNINPWEKWQSRSNVIRQIQKHFYLQDSLIRSVNKIDLFIWSETAIPNFSDAFNIMHDFSILANNVNANNVSILTGFADIELLTNSKNIPAVAQKYWDNPNIYYVAYNAALLINPNNEAKPKQIYHKMKLTPFSERIPYVELFSFLIPVLDWGVGISNWEKGENQATLHFEKEGKEADIGVIICIESIYPNFVANFASLGANLLVIITNDGWYDNTFGPEQHYCIGRMRAIETRRYIARCANTGISGFITPTGKSTKIAPVQVPIGLYSEIPLIEKKSIYTLLGDVLPIIALIFSIIIMIYSFIYKRNKQ